MNKFLNKTPFLVVVKDGRWDAYASASTFWTNFKLKIVQKMGGISDSVPPGEYLLTMQVTWKGLQYSLLPKE
jgi:hypothetical protein